MTEIRKGIQTEVLFKAGLLDPACCLSFVTRERTLDLVFENSRDKELVLKAMAVLLESRREVIFR